MPRDAPASIGEEDLAAGSLEDVPGVPAAGGSPARRDAAPIVELPPELETAILEAAARNREGMRLVREGRMPEAGELLKEAQSLLDAVEEQGLNAMAGQALAAARADALSNLGVYHRRQGDRELALRCLQHGLRLHRAAGARRRVLVAAHLNLAACHLEVQAPADALQHASAAVELGGQVVAAPELGADAPELDAGSEPPDAEADDYAVLAVAYHKVAEAYEGLREWGKATFAYMQAYEVVRHSLGPQHHLTKSFERSSRCPARACTPTPCPPVPRTPRTTPAGQRRLPQIQRPRSQASAGAPNARAYELSKEVFPSWPPQSASREERHWYALARQRLGSRQGNTLAFGGCEPTLESLASLRRQRS